jgi:hypothetical protein
MSLLLLFIAGEISIIDARRKRRRRDIDGEEQECTLSMVQDTISNFKTVQFAWSIDKSIITRHTNLVIILDGTPTYTIDFSGDPETAKPCSSQYIRCELPSGFNFWVPGESELQDVILTINDRVTAEQVLEMLNGIVGSMGTWNLQYNNCRSHVDKSLEALKLLSERSEALHWNVEASQRYKSSMEAIRSTDSKMLAGFKKYI